MNSRRNLILVSLPAVVLLLSCLLGVTTSQGAFDNDTVMKYCGDAIPTAFRTACSYAKRSGRPGRSLVDVLSLLRSEGLDGVYDRPLQMYKRDNMAMECCLKGCSYNDIIASHVC